MKELLKQAGDLLKPLGYKKLKSRFFKTEDGFFKLIDFQSGAYGRYFFVNICIHPVGLPKLMAGRLVIPDRPLEYECIIVQRIEQIVLDEATRAFRSGLVPCDDQELVARILSSLSKVIDSWFPKWCSFSTILAASDKELKHMITVAPIVFDKASAMLRFFCAFNLHEMERAQSYLAQCLSAPSGDYDFSLVHDYLRSLVSRGATVGEGA
jgi:hypothetical protein